MCRLERITPTVCAYFLIEFTDETHRSVLLFEKTRFSWRGENRMQYTCIHTVPAPWKYNNNSRIKKIFSRRLSFNFCCCYFAALYTPHITHRTQNIEWYEELRAIILSFKRVEKGFQTFVTWPMVDYYLFQRPNKQFQTEDHFSFILHSFEK